MIEGGRWTCNRALWAACLTALGLLLQFEAARAEMVEVAPGVNVTRKSFQAPVNEQPFFRFSEKAPQLRDADEQFVAEVIKAAGSRESAFHAAAHRGWQAIAANDFALAAKRFNQASLFAPEQSEIFHGFAIVVAARFNDAAIAEELFLLARKQPAPLPSLNADYGRVLLTVHRPQDAEPVLEQAVKDVPKFGSAWSNLGIARAFNGHDSGACAAADQAEKLENPPNVISDIQWIRRKAQCSP